MIVLGSWIHGSTDPYLIASREDTVEALSQFVENHPDHRCVPEAKKRIRQLNLCFRPKFFLVFEDEDLSGGIGFFDYSVTRKIEEATTIVHVSTDSEHSISAEFVDRQTGRSRVFEAHSIPPDTLWVTVGSRRVVSSSGGAHVIDGVRHPGSLSRGSLLSDLLDYVESYDGSGGDGGDAVDKG